MDLTRLYNLTTPELRSEAERLGVTDTYAMSRGQLIHAIRSEVEGASSEGFFGKVLGLAKWALAAAQEAPVSEPSVSASEPASVPEPASVLVSASVPASVPVSVPASVPVSVPASVPVSVPASVPVSPRKATSSPRGEVLEPAREASSAAVTERVAVPVSAPVAASALRPSSQPGSEPVASGPPSRPPAGVFSKSAGAFEEPFPTRTMARILAEQGHFKRSLAIYDTLLRNEPTNPELSAEVDDVRARSRARRPHAP